MGAAGNTQDVSSGMVIGDGVTATFDTQANNVTFASAIGGGKNGNIVKTGSGTLTLAAVNSYTGTTSINQGTLSFANGALNSTLNVQTNGGTLQWNGANTQDISGKLMLVDATTATFDTQANNVVFAAAIGGGTSASILKTGSGMLSLGGADNFTGTVTISQGTLALTNPNSLLPTANVVIGDANSGATNPTYYNSNGGGNAPINNLTVGVGVTGATPWSINGIWSCNVNGTVTLNSPLTILVNNANNLASVGPQTAMITGNGGGSGHDTLIFTHGSGDFRWEVDNTTNNTFAGNVHLVSGSLLVQGTNTGYRGQFFPTGSMFIIDTGATFVWGQSGYVETLDGLAGGGSMLGNPTLATLSINANNADNNGNRNFSGSLPTLGGVMLLGGVGTQQFSGSGITYTNATNLNNGTLELTNTTVWASPLTLGATNSPVLQLNAPAATDSWTLTQVVTGGSTQASVAKSGAGTVILSAADTFSGALAIQNGTLRIGINNALPIAGTVDFGAATTSGTLDLAGFSQQVGGLAVDATVPALSVASQVIGSSGAAGTATLTYSGGASSFGGTIQDVLGPNNGQNVALSVAAGSLSLSGPNTYAGGTNVAGGTLRVGANNSLPIGTTVTFGSATTNGTLDLGGFNQQGRRLGGRRDRPGRQRRHPSDWQQRGHRHDPRH